MKLVKEKNSPRGLVPACSDGRFDTVYESYLSELDPKGETARSKDLQFALAAAKDVRFREFLTRLSAPRYRTWKLATIAKSCDISLPEFADFWSKAQNMRTLARAQEGVYDVTGDMIADARSTFESCTRCDGFGFVPLTESGDEISESEIRETGNRPPPQIRPCPACNGTCKVRKPGDTDSRKMLLEMTGMVGKKSGVAVQINQSFSSLDSSVPRLNDISFDVSLDPVIDAAIDTEPDLSDNQ